MVKRIAFGTTLLDRGLRGDGIDGIGHYCQALLKEFSFDTKNFQIQPFSFGVSNSPSGAFTLPPYPRYLLESSLSWSSRNQAFFKEVDLIHSTDQFFPLTSSKPLIATVMDAIPLSHPQWLKPQSRYLKPIVWKQFVKRSDHIITISEFSKQQIVEYLSIPEGKITSIPLGVDPQFFERIPNEVIRATLERHQIHKPFFLFIGSIQPRKNLVRLLRAHQALPKRFAKEYPLVIVGKCAWQDPETLQALHDAELDGRCIWLQYVNELDKRCLLQSALALTFVSLYEGFGLPILEAYASQTPVITSSTTALTEITYDVALKVNPSDIDEMIDALQTIANQQLNVTELVQRGLNIAKHHSWQRTAHETIKVYRRFIN
jgi:glycosyltransferase involved in cell wall biosynthesis